MLNKHDYQERRIRSAVRESRDLDRRRFTIVRLSEPIQQGWRRFHVLTEHAKRRKDAETLATILKLIGYERVSRRPDFRAKQRRTKRLIEIGQPLSQISEWEWYRRSLPADWLMYFHVFRYWQWGRRTFHLEFAYPYLFELRVEPRWIWEFREVDPDLETRIGELDRWMQRTRAWDRWYHLKGGSSWRRYPNTRRRSIDRVHEREIRNAMRGEVELRSSARRLQFSLSTRSKHRTLALHRESLSQRAV